MFLAYPPIGPHPWFSCKMRMFQDGKGVIYGRGTRFRGRVEAALQSTRFRGGNVSLEVVVGAVATRWNPSTPTDRSRHALLTLLVLVQWLSCRCAGAPPSPLWLWLLVLVLWLLVLVLLLSCWILPTCCCSR